VLAAAPLTEAFRAINVFDWCGSEPRAELYWADSAAVLALALRGERADVVAAAGPEALAPLVEAGLALPPRRFATQGGVEYWIAPLRGAREPATAQAFVDAVLSRRGQAVLRAQGFRPEGPSERRGRAAATRAARRLRRAAGQVPAGRRRLSRRCGRARGR
jgi:ABC-type Fe3+ transport system substrate-binding protein